MGKENGTSLSAVNAPPDALGRASRVETVAGMFRTIQANRFNLDVEQTANGLVDEDQVPGSRPPVTIAQRKKELGESERRMMEAYEELMPDVRRVLEQNLGREG